MEGRACLRVKNWLASVQESHSSRRDRFALGHSHIMQKLQHQHSGKKRSDVFRYARTHYETHLRSQQTTSRLMKRFLEVMRMVIHMLKDRLLYRPEPVTSNGTGALIRRLHFYEWHGALIRWRSRMSRPVVHGRMRRQALDSADLRPDRRNASRNTQQKPESPHVPHAAWIAEYCSLKSGGWVSCESLVVSVDDQHR